MENLRRNCLLCACEDLTYLTNVREDKSLGVYTCSNCGLVQISPLPMAEEDDAYYRHTIVYRHLIKENSMDDIKLMEKLKPWTISQFETLKKYLRMDVSILEIGSGYGWLIQKLREAGYTADGIEINHQQRKMAKERAGIDLYSYNLMMEFPKNFVNRYDVVCAFHVLEHMSNPVVFLQAAAKALKLGGTIIIEVPNNEDYIKNVSTAYAEFSFKRQHLCYYTERTLRAVMEKAGLVNIAIQGIQRYSIENALHWARTNEPFIDYYQLDVPESLEFVDEFYKKRLQDDMVSENILSVAIKR